MRAADTKRLFRIMAAVAIIGLWCYPVVAAVNLTSLHMFAGPDGETPENESLAQDSAYLYGMTPFGGEHNCGVIYRMKKDGTEYTILHNFFEINNDGANPHGGLILSGSTLYGMTSIRVSQAPDGTIFKINTDGTGYTILRRFNDGTVPYDGKTPLGGLVISGSTLYGMTSEGGTGGCGTVFKINTNGTGYAILHSFLDGSVANDGANPYGSLIISGENLYGMTSGGGSGGYGTIFKINTRGKGYAVLHSFMDGTVANDGAIPKGSLVLSGPWLYGLTSGGGDFGFTFAGGTLFRIKANGSDYAILHSFFDGTVADDGANPYGSLIISGQNLYGMTSSGGTGSSGTIFKIGKNGANYSILYSFSKFNTFGSYPQGTLLADGTRLYGTTSRDGNQTYLAGTIFSFPLRYKAVPEAPTGVKATSGNGLVKVRFAPPPPNGGKPITSYIVTSNPGGITQTGKTTQITVKGLTSGKAYTFTVQARNAVGTGPASKPSNSVIPK